jgi:uncharacterized protein
MGNIEKHKPGNFCWIELEAADQDAAKKFYGELFGWTWDDNPIGPNDFYTIFKIGDRQVGATYTMPPQRRGQGVPPHWLVYVATESADASAKRATELGATIVAGPMDVSDAGRMAVIRDPGGAHFCVWEAKKHVGSRITGVPGTLCAADLVAAADQDAASDFYEKLFGWQIKKEDEEPGHRYYHIFNGGEFIGGIPPASFAPKGAPSHWQIYVQVADCKASVAKAKSLGAQIYMPTMKVEDVGWMAIVADPEGASFAMFQAAGKKQ